MSNARIIAARTLAALLENQGSLSSHLEKQRAHPDFQRVQEYCYGCCRYFYALQFFVDCLIKKPLKGKDTDLLGLLLVGLYELREMRTPDHAAINETVEAAVLLKKPWAKALINGVLRNYLRQQGELQNRLDQQAIATRLSHPDWLVAALQKQWPEDIEALLLNNNLRPPMTLRVNLSKQTRNDYMRSLDDTGLASAPGKFADAAVYLEQPVNVTDLPGFQAGLVSVQDEASQLVPPLLDLQPQQRVLDACTAPGGKLCHILESEHSLTEVVAVDVGEARLARVSENLERLGLQANIMHADAADLSSWWDGECFDRILLDAPCSATGVIRRHPDIKLLRSSDAIATLKQQQLHLLQSIWPSLATGGLLLYTTCSILDAENSQVIEHFLGTQPDAKYEGVAADWGVECSYGRQLLPLEQNGPDGFFYSLLRKH